MSRVGVAGYHGDGHVTSSLPVLPATTHALSGRHRTLPVDGYSSVLHRQAYMRTDTRTGRFPFPASIEASSDRGLMLNVNTSQDVDATEKRQRLETTTGARVFAYYYYFVNDCRQKW